MNIRRNLTAVALAAVTAVTSAACSSPGGSSESNAAAQSQKLRLALVSAPSSLAIGEYSGETLLPLSVYDTIVGIDLQGKVVPGIAESWKYSNDRKALTLTIRSGMKFTDGAPVDAAAVVASLGAARKGSATATKLTSIVDVKAVDATTVVVTLSRPDAALLPVLGGVTGAVASPKSLTTESAKLFPVASGPYTLDKSATTVGAVYTLKRNPDYWNVKKYPYQTVEMRVFTDPTAASNAMRAGQLDAAAVASDQKKQYDNGKFHFVTSKPQAVGAIWFADRAGKAIPALADKRVRQAINLAFDRNTIASSLNAGASHATNQLLSPIDSAFIKDATTNSSFNVEAAKKLMADAGFAGGFAVTMPSVQGVTTTYESVVAQELGDIGIKVTWTPVPFQDLFQKIFTGKYPMFFFYNGLSNNTAVDTQAALTGLFNPTQFMTPELQALLDAANAASDDDQAAAFRAVNQYLIDEAWAAPIVYITSENVVSNKVTFTAPVTGINVLPYAPAGS